MTAKPRIARSTPLGEVAMDIFSSGLEAVDPKAAILRTLSLDGARLSIDRGDGDHRQFEVGPDGAFDDVLVLGAGKASARMCQAVESVLGELVSGGLVVVKDGHSVPTDRVEVVEASHPVPDERGMAASKRILDLADSAGERTLIIVLISGGGSALLPLPAEGITLAEKQAVTDRMLSAGADIGEMNAVRKHLSAIKGGMLARHAAPATVLSLILSDVVGDRLDVIASGPTVPDESTFATALDVFRRRGLTEELPEAVRRRLEAGERGDVRETPKRGESCFDKGEIILVGTNRVALQACFERARALGWNSLILASTIEGETRDVARMHSAIVKEIKATNAPISPPACIISGGETTVTIRGNGKGGRNQEFALASAFDIEGLKGVAVVSAGTDGTDGPTDATGAIVYGDSLSRAREQGLDPRASLEDNDAYPFFESLGELVITGPTHTNVMDVHILLVE